MLVGSMCKIRFVSLISVKDHGCTNRKGHSLSYSSARIEANTDLQTIRIKWLRSLYL